MKKKSSASVKKTATKKVVSKKSSTSKVMEPVRTSSPPPKAPPVKASAPEFPRVMMSCRRGTDKMTSGESCDGRMAFRLSKMGAQNVLFRCVKCNFSWNVPVGGASPV